jgi:hypothetical protein
MGMTPRFNFHGFINERGGDKNYGYTQIFRNGVLEATRADIVVNRGQLMFIPGEEFEQKIIGALPSYINGLREIGVPPPLIVMFSLEGIRNVFYAVTATTGGRYDTALSDNSFFLPECILEDYGTDLDYHKSVRPAFDALWNAIGYPKAMSFNEEGRWLGIRRS